MACFPPGKQIRDVPSFENRTPSIDEKVELLEDTLIDFNEVQ